MRPLPSRSSPRQTSRPSRSRGARAADCRFPGTSAAAAAGNVSTTTGPRSARPRGGASPADKRPFTAGTSRRCKSTLPPARTSELRADAVGLTYTPADRWPATVAANAPGGLGCRQAPSGLFADAQSGSRLVSRRGPVVSRVIGGDNFWLLPSSTRMSVTVRVGQGVCVNNQISTARRRWR